ncbi:MAG: hypothetical protein IJK98_03805 [Clostridia bacterium]|nr:hypothetical protein [Clostridia bacterium]
MTEKILLPFYTVLSTLIYVVLLAGILAIPLLFASQANAPLDFELESIEIAPAAGSDETFAASGYAPEGWYRIDYRMDVGSAKLSPYSYTVDSFALKAPTDFKKTGAYFVSLDAPLSFSRAQRDDFVLSLYVSGFADEAAVSEFARTVGFGTRGITRAFSVFKTDLEMFVPGFYVAELV